MRNDDNTILVLVLSIDYDGQASTVVVFWNQLQSVHSVSLTPVTVIHTLLSLGRPDLPELTQKYKLNLKLEQPIYKRRPLLNVWMESEEPETVTECCQKRKLLTKTPWVG